MIHHESASNNGVRRPRRSIKGYAGLVLRGFFMGTADAIPGVSGGTVALLVGIYEELILSIRAVADPRHISRLVRFQFRSLLAELPWPFLLAVVSGILVGAVSLAHILESLLERVPLFVWAFFFGMVAASAIVVARRIHHWKVSTIALLIAGTVSAYLIIGLVPVNTPDTLLAFFLSGMIAICAMILPGISGAFILVLLGKYEDVLAAVTGFEVLRLVVFMAGAVIGISSFARVLGWLFRKYHDATIALMIGLMVGSLRKLWPWKISMAGSDDLFSNVLPLWSSETAAVMGIALVGFSLVIGVEVLASRQKSDKGSLDPAPVNE
jgi:putative membrane protein